MSMAHEYENEREAISRGNRCQGGECRGWVLSDFDTWEQCGCGASANHPHPESEEEEG